MALSPWTIGRLPETSSYNMAEDYLAGPGKKSKNLSLNEAVGMSHNRPLRRLMSAFGTTHF